MWAQSTGASGVTYRLTAQTKNAGTDAVRTEYVVRRVTGQGDLIWGRYFDNLRSATSYYLKKLREH